MTFDILRIQVVNGSIIDILFEKSAEYIFFVVASKINDPRRQFYRPNPSKYIVLNTISNDMTRVTFFSLSEDLRMM